MKRERFVKVKRRKSSRHTASSPIPASVKTTTDSWRHTADRARLRPLRPHNRLQPRKRLQLLLHNNHRNVRFVDEVTAVTLLPVSIHEELPPQLLPQRLRNRKWFAGSDTTGHR